MRDILVFAFVMLSLPTCFRRPFYGLLVFSWLAYMRPQDLCWGFARTMRLSFFVAVAMVAGWWAVERGKRTFTVWDGRTRLIVGLGLLVAISYATATVQDAYTNTYFFEFIKILVIALFTAGQIDSKSRFKIMIWTIAACLAFFGIKGGILGVLGGGKQIMRGPGGMLEDNNDFALALVMNLPLLWYMGMAEGRPLLARACKVAMLLTVITIVLTHSRGAFLAMTASAIWIAWRSGRLLRAAGTLAVLGLVFVIAAPREVIERLGSIGDTQESSAAARLNSWATAFNMIGDNPIWGVGMRNFQSRYREYSVVPLPEEAKTYVAHNSYLQIWAESGTLAFLIYFVLLVSVFVTCRRLFRIGRSRTDLQWVADYARMMEATTVGFMIGAFFLNRGHFDLIYHWLALVTGLVVVTHRAVRMAPAGLAAPARRGAGAREIKVSWRGDGVGRMLQPGVVRQAPVWRRRS